MINIRLFVTLLLCTLILHSCRKGGFGREDKKRQSAGIDSPVTIQTIPIKVATSKEKGEGLLRIKAPFKVTITCQDCAKLDLKFEQKVSVDGKFRYEASFEHPYVIKTARCPITLTIKGEDFQQTRKYGIYRCPTRLDNNDPLCDKSQAVDECF